MVYEKSVGTLSTDIHQTLHVWIEHDLRKGYNLDLERRVKPVLCFDDVFRLLFPKPFHGRGAFPGRIFSS
ncbi:hypothetical protein QBC40DRAFT_255923 [Triangularia verruculosa]|uniref:Uncharacterized protein n=1 Tax=Triangularia verruculosa TaxID=2587418 RepID=A0AAN7AU26_9PEZI|nr:hypothetical protein QBC40DRAFT_255923 [Triangularia verruculosa]